MSNIQISKYLKLKEFDCSYGSCVVKLDSRLLEKLQLLRDKLNVHSSAGNLIVVDTAYF